MVDFFGVIMIIYIIIISFEKLVNFFILFVFIYHPSFIFSLSNDYVYFIFQTLILSINYIQNQNYLALSQQFIILICCFIITSSFVSLIFSIFFVLNFSYIIQIFVHYSQYNIVIFPFRSFFYLLYFLFDHSSLI